MYRDIVASLAGEKAGSVQAAGPHFQTHQAMHLLVESKMEYGLLCRDQAYITGILAGNPSECSEGTVLYHHELFEQDHFKLGNRTVLDPGGEELYRIIDHDTGMLYTYDRFSRKYEASRQSIREYIEGFILDSLELAKA